MCFYVLYRNDDRYKDETMDNGIMMETGAVLYCIFGWVYIGWSVNTQLNNYLLSLKVYKPIIVIL